MNQISLASALNGPAVRHIALIGNSAPRRCGIASFTADCHDALRARFPDMIIDRYAMDDGDATLAYDADVTLIAQDDPISYSAAAHRIEESGAEAIWLQHEFGIFGGPAGDLILALLARTQLPLLTTLHTVLEHPGDDERRVIDALLARSSQVMVMAERGRAILRRCHGVSDARINVIPHGVPDRPLVDPDSMKPRFGWAGRRVILTFGLLAPDKGIDLMIRAMPAIVAAHPDALYVVLGATHPNLVREQGETLSDKLKALAVALGVGDHVAFIGSFVDQEPLLDHLQAADLYVTPYGNPAQITSGTLSYAVGLGKAVVSTPYVHAGEILADDHGVLVPFGDSKALAAAVTGLLGDEPARLGYATRAYARGRAMLWSELARRAGRLLVRARDAHPARITAPRHYAPLEPDLAAILRMSDSTGIFQHGILSVPDRRHGYCVDDNARALMLMCRMPVADDESDSDGVLRDQWTTTYASFVQHAWNADLGRFRNFMAYDRSWCEDSGSEDSCGRSLWSLGIAARDAPLARHREWATRLFDQCIGPLGALGAPRAQAFAMLGVAAMLDARPVDDQSRRLIGRFGTTLVALADRARRSGWRWFEDRLAYDNARLPEALLRGGHAIGDEAMIACGLATLYWVVERQTASAGHFRAVGAESFGRAYADPLPFDQQPLEALATIEAAEAAFAIDGDERWIMVAETAYGWFLGRNDLGVPLATRDDGGCFDGLTPYGVNRNQGAESLLALQLSSCAMVRLAQRTSADGQAAGESRKALPA